MSFFTDLWYKVVNRNTALNDPNFGASMQLYSPGQPIWSDKDYRTFVRTGYRKNPAVYTCINLICGAAAGIEWQLYTDRTRKKTIDNHPLLDLWRNPNPRMPSTGSFIEQNFGYWHMAGNDYIYAARPNPNQPPMALWALRPDRMKAVAGQYSVSGYVYGYGTNNVQDYDASEVCHIKFPGYDDDIYGLSPIEVASYFADQQNEAMGWNLALMQNAGRPASAFFSKGYLTEEQRNQIKAEIRRNYSGKRNAGRPLILEADMTWQNMSLTPMELDFLKSYELGTRAICAILNVAPELAGDSAGKTFANVAEARQALYLENALPKLDRFSDYMNVWLVPMYPDLKASGAYFTYNRDDIEALQALYAAQKKAVHDMARADFMAGGITLAEYCELIGAEAPAFGKVRRFGGILVSEDSLEDYADQSITEPAAPPMPVPEPLNVPGGNPTPALPAPGKKPTNPKLPTNPKTPVQAPQKPVQGKSLDANGIWQPDDLQARLDAFKAAGVTHLRWIEYSKQCDICTQNNGVVVPLGMPFPSGHILPPGHPNCICDVVAADYTDYQKYMMQELAYKVAQLLEKSKVEPPIHTHENIADPFSCYYDGFHYVTCPLEGYKSHEQNTTMGNVDTTQNRRMSLRFLPVEAQDGSEGQTITVQSKRSGLEETASMTSRDVYRAFIERYVL